MHATQTGLPILIDTVRQTGEYSVVDVISRSTPRKQYVMQDKEVIWVTRTTQTKTAYMLHKGVDVPDIESVQPFFLLWMCERASSITRIACAVVAVICDVHLSQLRPQLFINVNAQGIYTQTYTHALHPTTL